MSTIGINTKSLDSQKMEYIFLNLYQNSFPQRMYSAGIKSDILHGCPSSSAIHFARALCYIQGLPQLSMVKEIQTSQQVFPSIPE